MNGLFVNDNTTGASDAIVMESSDTNDLNIRERELVVDVSDPNVQVTGMDCIWHNMDTTSDHAFITFRKWFSHDLDAMMIRVAEHIQRGLYSLIAISASKHSLVVICASRLAVHDFPEGAWAG